MPLTGVTSLVQKALELDKFAIARLITVFEDSRNDAPEKRRALLAELDASENRRDAVFLGITGTPGAGKSTLTGRLANHLAREDENIAVAVLAVDPSSRVSGGALLGDRTRVEFAAGEKRLFFRSQASDRELGGVSRTTFQVCRLLSRLFDYVFVETVGIGQSEIEIQFVVDRTYLILQPMAGDQVQFMKAGIMEVPQVFVLNKSDEIQAAEKSYHALRATLAFTRPGEEDELEIFRVSARTGLGLDSLLGEMRSARDELNRLRGERDKESYFFAKWVRDEFGRRGLRRLGPGDGVDAARDFIRDAGDFDLAQTRFLETHAGVAPGSPTGS